MGQIPDSLTEAVKKLFRSSFEPIEWKYHNLTHSERSCITEEQFLELREICKES